MIDRHHPDSVEAAELIEQDLAIAALVGRYIERREHDQPSCVHDLLAAAAEFGDAAADVRRRCSPVTRRCVPATTSLPDDAHRMC
jgi:hypothetical protein